MPAAEPDAWTAYLRAVGDAQAEMQAACIDAETAARAIRDAAVKPARAVFEAKRAAAWVVYTARVKAEGEAPALR